jgi:hypothetical protein
MPIVAKELKKLCTLALTVEAYRSNEGADSTFDCVRIHIHDLSDTFPSKDAICKVCSMSSMSTSVFEELFGMSPFLLEDEVTNCEDYVDSPLAVLEDNSENRRPSLVHEEQCEFTDVSTVPSACGKKCAGQTITGGTLGSSARRTKDLLKLNRDQLRWVVGLLTGHRHLKGHLF